MNVDQAIEYAYQLCVAMEFANKKGEIAHLDLKPENILIDQNDVLKVTDFGLAHRVRIIQGQYAQLDSGTWLYTAPERFLGKAEDTRSDIYTFGIILNEMLTGKFPYPFHKDNDSKTQFKQLSAFYADPKNLNFHEGIYWRGIPGVSSEGASFIVSGCLDPLPSGRFKNFTILREHLERTFRLSLNKVITNAQASVDDLHARALTLHRIEDYSKALSIFNRLLQQYPNEAQLWLDTAKTLLASGQTEAAHDFLQRALALDPNLNQALRLLDSQVKE